MKRQEKVEVIEGLKTQFAKANATYITQFTGLTVAEMNDLRTRVREANGRYQVVKNTLVRLGATGSQYEPLVEKLQGAYGWAFTEDDPVTLAKALKKFDTENEIFSIYGGIVEGETLDAKGISVLADLPSKEVLRAQFLGVLSAPARQMATLVQAVPQQILTVIDAYRRKKEEESNNG